MSINKENTKLYKTYREIGVHDTIRDYTKYLYINILYNHEINKLFSIKIFLEQYPNLLPNFISNNPELLHIEVGNVELKKEVKKYIDEFLMELNINTEIYTKYENIVDENGCIQCMESLLRIENKDIINHIDFLQIHNKLGKSFYIFFRVIHKVFKDIKEGKINGNISINAEISDIENNDFFMTIISLKKYYGIDFQSNPICIEILENQKIPQTDSFKNKIKQLKDIGIKIALDDLYFEEDKIEESINSINSIGENLDAIKLDGKNLQSFYNMYKINKGQLNILLKKVKKLFAQIQDKGIKIVAEWVENEEIYKFAKEVLGLKSFQGYYFK